MALPSKQYLIKYCFKNMKAIDPHQQLAAGPKDVTTILSSCLPWDAEYSTSWQGRVMYGMRILK